LHDDNWSGKLDTDWIGVPKKGVGTSNNVYPAFSPPSYKVSSFDIADEPKTITIKMKYFLGK
jgi:uncharacterized protein (DUF2141 family)